MALVSVLDGQAMTASQVQQVINLLTGAMTDQQVTLAHASNNPLILNRTDAAGIKALLALQRAGVTKYWLGLDASDQFAILNAAANAVNFGMTDLGVGTFRGEVIAPDLKISGISGLSNPQTGTYVGQWTTIGAPAGLAGALGQWGQDANANPWYYNGTAWIPVGVHVVYEFDTTSVPVASLRIPASGNFPPGYRHMRITSRQRDAGAGTGSDGMHSQINGDTANNYTWSQFFESDNATTGPLGSSGATSAARMGVIIQGGLNANWWATGIATMYDFSDSVHEKVWNWIGYQKTSTASGGSGGFTGHGAWWSTAAVQNMILKVATASTNLKIVCTVEMWA